MLELSSNISFSLGSSLRLTNSFLRVSCCYHPDLAWLVKLSFGIQSDISFRSIYHYSLKTLAFQWFLKSSDTLILKRIRVRGAVRMHFYQVFGQSPFLSLFRALILFFCFWDLKTNFQPIFQLGYSVLNHFELQLIPNGRGYLQIQVCK